MKRFRGGTVFIDAFLLLILWLLLTLVPPEPVRTSPVDQRAEFLITVTWPDDSASDVDTWFRAPSGELISFQDKQSGVYHLDKDDTGRRADTITLPDGSTKTVHINQEILTMRGWVPGEYVLNIHLYAHRDDKPVPVTVSVLRLNPFRQILERQVVLDMRGQEETVASFTLDARGRAHGISHEFVRLAKRNGGRP